MSGIDKRKNLAGLIVGAVGAFAGLLCLVQINRVLMYMPVMARMPAAVISYWIIAFVPFAIIFWSKDKPQDYGFVRNNLIGQIVTGLIIGIIMSLVLTFLPHIAGFGNMVDNGRRYMYWWQFVYEFVYCIFAVGLAEEFVFRGFIYRKIELLSNSQTVAITVSSILFGLFHFLGGSIVQIVITGCIGAMLCILRSRIKGCTIISLIIAHGVYDALITVWAAVFLM